MDSSSRMPGSSALTLLRYLVAAVPARLADEGARVSLLLLAVTTTGSAAVGGLLVAALLLPHVVASPLVGLLVDRAARPRCVLALAVAGFAASLAGAGALVGRAPLPIVVLVLVVGGCCGPAVTGGLTSQLPDLVGQERVPRAFAIDSLFYNVAGMAGPALVGVVAAVSGPAAAHATLAACAMVGALGTAALPAGRGGSARSTESARGGAGGSVGLSAGARAVLTIGPLRSVTALSSLGQLGLGGLGVVAVGLAAAQGRASVGGLLLTALAAGSLLGSLACVWHPVPARRASAVMSLSLIGTGIPIAVAAFTWSSLPVVAALFGLSGVFVGPFAAALFLARTRYAPAPVRTQVFTIGAGLKVAAAAAGALGLGYAATLPIATQLLMVAGTALLAGTIGVCTALRGTPAGVTATKSPSGRRRPRRAPCATLRSAPGPRGR